MLEQRRCIPCGGSGKVLGGGMITKSCESCAGVGKVDVPQDDLDYLIVQQSDAYKEALGKIKAIDPTLSDDEVKNMFRDKFKALEDEKPEANVIPIVEAKRVTRRQRIQKGEALS